MSVWLSLSSIKINWLLPRNAQIISDLTTKQEEIKWKWFKNKKISIYLTTNIEKVRQRRTFRRNLKRSLKLKGDVSGTVWAGVRLRRVSNKWGGVARINWNYVRYKVTLFAGWGNIWRAAHVGRSTCSNYVICHWIEFLNVL